MADNIDDPWLNNDDPWLKPKEAAAYLGLTPKTLRNWRSLKKGPTYAKLGGRARYRRSWLDEWWNAHPIHTSTKEYTSTWKGKPGRPPKPRKPRQDGGSTDETAP
jgi:predicted DNA-binding transcriptional regulator AlpA